MAKGQMEQRMPDWQSRQPGFTQKEFDMNWDIVAGNWKQYSGKVKTQWGKLTDDHLDMIAGKRDQLAGKIKDFEKSNKDVRP